MGNIFSNVITGGQTVGQALNQPKPIIQQPLTNQLNWVQSLSKPTPTPAPVAQNNGGGGNNGSNQQQQSRPYVESPQDRAQREEQARQDNLRNEISSGWDNYLGSLGEINNGLSDQRTAQENIANSQLTQGQNSLQTQQSKSLRDIADNIKNSFQAGNIYLGARGAGDSSAADQYGFAVQQQGAKQTGNLNEFVTNKMSELSSDHDQKINQIASWFADAQNQIRQQIASGQLNKAKDIASLTQNILNQALAAKAQVTQNAQNQYNTLVQWAANNSHNVDQLRGNIAAIPQALGTPSVDSGGNFIVPVGYGGSGSNDQNRQALF